MRVFLTGATGFIGTVVAADLIAAGHQVLGLARSDVGAAALKKLGVEVHRGELIDTDSLVAGARHSEGVIHCGFIHDFSKFKENCEIDERAIDALGSALVCTNRPLVVTAGTALIAPGEMATENQAQPIHSAMPRVSEKAAMQAVSKGVRASVIRLPQVHDPDKQGLVTYLIDIAREKGISAYVGNGSNRWPACHRLDAAPLYRLALEKGTAGAKYHAVAEEGVPVREIAEAIGRGLKIPVVSLSPDAAANHFGWLSFFAAMDCPASSQLTQQRLGWRPTQTIGMIADLDRHDYFAS